MNKTKLEQRMYCLVLRHLSPLNKGIQCTHACEQYGELYRNEPDYRKYIEEDKTLIMLEGGTSIDMTLIEAFLLSPSGHVQHYAFKEPDLMNLTTAICFLADERIWNFEKYPDNEISFKAISDPDYNRIESDKWFKNFIESIGGKQNLTKLEIIYGKRLAS